MSRQEKLNRFVKVVGLGSLIFCASMLTSVYALRSASVAEDRLNSRSAFMVESVEERQKICMFLKTITSDLMDIRVSEGLPVDDLLVIKADLDMITSPLNNRILPE